MRTIHDHTHSNMIVHPAQTFEGPDVTAFMGTIHEYTQPSMMVHQVQTFGTIEEPDKSMFMSPYQIHPAQTLEQLSQTTGEMIAYQGLDMPMTANRK